MFLFTGETIIEVGENALRGIETEAEILLGKLFALCKEFWGGGRGESSVDCSCS